MTDTLEIVKGKADYAARRALMFAVINRGRIEDADEAPAKALRAAESALLDAKMAETDGTPRATLMDLWRRAETAAIAARAVMKSAIPPQAQNYR